MASAKKSKYILEERKIRDDQEIQSILFMEEESDDEPEEEWVVQKAMQSIESTRSLRVRLSPLRTPFSNSTGGSPLNSKVNGNGQVSPIKIKRKLSYAVKKVSTPTKRPDIVSPIRIKRISDREVSLCLTPTKTCKLPTIVVDSSDDDDSENRPTERNSRNKAKKKTILTSEESDFEVTTPSKRKMSYKKSQKYLEENNVDESKGKMNSTHEEVSGRGSPHLRKRIARVEQAMKNVLSIASTRPKRTPTKNYALNNLEALNKADTTPVKGFTPAKEVLCSLKTPIKGAVPAQEAYTPSKITPAKGTTPSRSSKNLVSISLDLSDEDIEPTGTSSRKCRKDLKRSATKENTRKTSLDENKALHTPRRSLRLSQSPSTPSLRQKVLLANTPRQSRLQTIKDLESEDEEEDNNKTPRKSIRSAKKKLEMSPCTPSSARRVGRGFLSPAIADREVRAPTTPSSELGKARSQLQVSTLPKSLPCREKEFFDVKSFILRKIQDRTGGCMYISGVPGTGKTATLHAVVKDLQQMTLDDLLPSFDFVEVNGLRLTEPRQAYVRIDQALNNSKVSPDQALKHLETKFSGKPKRCTLLLVDELDYLCNKRQDVIYNILDWTTKQHSKLIVLTIANTMDLPERTLKGKVTSRMGLTRIVFQPYTFQQLEEIVMNRLDSCKAFHADAVQLVARKVAAVSGDARRALDICRRSTEILELEGRSIVSVLEIQRVLTQIFAGSRVQAIKNCSSMSKLVLRAIRDEVLRTGLEETSVAFICPQLISVCALEGKKEPTPTSLLAICTDLAESGLIFAEKARNDINRRISLNVSPDDIHYAINC